MRTRGMIQYGLALLQLLPLQAAKKIDPKPGVAILFNEWTSHVAVTQIDGVEEGIKAHGTNELAPGIHTVRVWLHYQTDRIEVWGHEPVDYPFEAQPGTVILLVCEEHTASKEKGTWQVLLKDQSSGKIVPPRQTAAPSADEPSPQYAATLKQAEAGEAQAQYEAGLACMQGAGVPADPARATEWYRKAAEQGHTTAAYLLGLAYDQGDGVTRDPEAAYLWLSVAAERGEPDAPYYRDQLAKELSAAARSRADERRAALLKAMPRPTP